MCATGRLAVGFVTCLMGWNAVVALELGTLQERTRLADLVFEGRVLRVEPAPARPCDSVPHMLVTFGVDRVSKGRAGSEVTLRFLGEPEGDRPHLVAPWPGGGPAAPLFAPGDTVLVLVRRGEADDPLEGWRFADGKATNTWSIWAEAVPVGELEARIGERLGGLVGRVRRR